MTKQTRTILKGYFETGDIPTQGQYQDLIDSQLSLLDTDVQIVSGTISSSFLEVQHHITSSGNISSSGDLTVKDAEVSNDLTVRGDIKIAQASKIECITDSSTHIQLQNDDTWLFDAAGVEILKLTNDGSAGTPALIVNEGSADVDFRVESNGDTRAIFVDSGNDRVQIGSSTSTKLAVGTSTFGNSLVTINGDVTATHITSSGNISASGNITGETGSFDNGIILTAPNGNKFRFTVNNSGHLSVTGSAV